MKKEESDQRLSQKNNIMIVFLWISFNLILVSGSSDGKEVIQKPEGIFSKLGPSVKLTCRHEIDTYNQIYWYKQVKSKEMQFLGNMVGSSAKPEDETVKIEGNANANKNCTLTILAVDLNSSAVYFCAASTQCFISLLLNTKTL
ncbi:immunoglobulin lambda-1 light chain-like [Xyrichtys novacula]|nr:immunoglobulin lambda-1 light chain-like [Xyrichtys novacula]